MSRFACLLLQYGSGLLTLYSSQKFGWQTFKRIGELVLHTGGFSLTVGLSGASLEINRIYKVILTFSIGLQLAFFCVIASMGLWVDFLMTTDEGQLSKNGDVYKVITILMCIVCATLRLVNDSRLTSSQLMVPWMYLGWTSVRRENKILMRVFVPVSLVLLDSWGGIFVSGTFRRTFMN